MNESMLGKIVKTPRGCGRVVGEWPSSKIEVSFRSTVDLRVEFWPDEVSVATADDLLAEIESLTACAVGVERGESIMSEHELSRVRSMARRRIGDVCPYCRNTPRLDIRDGMAVDCPDCNGTAHVLVGSPAYIDGVESALIRPPSTTELDELREWVRRFIERAAGLGPIGSKRASIIAAGLGLELHIETPSEARDLFDWAMSPMTTGLADALWAFEPTGVGFAGTPVWRTFESKQEWISKAQSWMRPGDVCLDADGVQLRMGRDFDDARYPVTIARPRS